MGYRISTDYFINIVVEILVDKGIHSETIVKVIDWYMY